MISLRNTSRLLRKVKNRLTAVQWSADVAVIIDRMMMGKEKGKGSGIVFGMRKEMMFGMQVSKKMMIFSRAGHSGS